MPPPEFTDVPQSFEEPLQIPEAIAEVIASESRPSRPVVKSRPLAPPPKITAPLSEKKKWIHEAASRGPVNPALVWLMDPSRGFG